MPALAVARWAEFERDFGPLTVQERLDGVIRATIAASGETPPARIWRRPERWTEENLFAWLDREAQKGP